MSPSLLLHSLALSFPVLHSPLRFSPRPGTKMTQVQTAMAMLIKAFHAYSGKEGDPLTLTKNELKALLQNELGDICGKSKDQSAVDKIFKDLDSDKSGTVDFNEYINLVCCLTMLCNDFFTQKK